MWRSASSSKTRQGSAHEQSGADASKCRNASDMTLLYFVPSAFMVFPSDVEPSQREASFQ
jgi:hypothetical protein